ncbi:Glypican-5 [Fukomys damarensis]|uniref:Glypican-5 n=1 Tax=Fukomys damarensis TaxID=885580 RepID=A0A091E3A6_FUKDA|nr:Glypican-5 [Fukomys damarensis]
MGAQRGSVGFRCLLLLALFGCTRSEGVQTCEEVRKLFQWRLAGAVKGLPDSPRAGSCSSRRSLENIYIWDMYLWHIFMDLQDRLTMAAVEESGVEEYIRIVCAPENKGSSQESKVWSSV